jgi:hypothetical protein
MPPLGTTNATALKSTAEARSAGAAQAAPAPTDTISGEGVYNRTLDGIFAKLPYVHYEARTEVFRKHGARTAYTFRDKKLVPIMYSERMHTQGPARDFRRFATAWELRHSKVPFGDGHGSVFPVVDENMVVVGHYGSFDSSQIFVPADLPTDGKVEEESSGGRVYTGGKMHNVYVPGQRFVRVVKSKLSVKDMLEVDVPVFANKYDGASYRNRGYQPYDVYHRPQLSVSVVTDIEGRVVLFVDSRDKDGITPSAFSPLDLISIAKLVLLGVSAAAGALMVRTLIRRRAAKALAQSAKRELGAGAGNQAAQEAAREAAQVASKIPVQARKVTTADILKWEKEGGHIVQNHGPQLTGQKLKERVLKQERNIPNPANRPRIDGEVPKDFRVWRGKDAMAASKWTSDEVMHKAIGDVIHKNLAAVRRVTGNGGEVILSKQVVGYKTGEGWVTAAGQGATRPLVYDTNLRSVTIVIRRRKNHVPTKDDPEGWYVHTAFPEK